MICLFTIVTQFNFVATVQQSENVNRQRYVRWHAVNEGKTGHWLTGVWIVPGCTIYVLRDTECSLRFAWQLKCNIFLRVLCQAAFPLFVLHHHHHPHPHQLCTSDNYDMWCQLVHWVNMYIHVDVPEHSPFLKKEEKFYTVNSVILKEPYSFFFSFFYFFSTEGVDNCFQLPWVLYLCLF